MNGPITIYMFGYAGWGNATRQLVKAVDAVENRRRWKPPLFVDIRIRRNVRAVGFQGDTFGNRFGSDRYMWMPCLGNRRVLQGRNGIEIQCPASAEDLLELALTCSKRKQHIICFCSCDLPCDCHRQEVASLLLKAARRRHLALEVVEWPGGDPEERELHVLDRNVPKDKTSRLYLPKKADVVDFVGLALGSLVTTKGRSRTRTVAVAPAMYGPKGWFLPVLQTSRGRVIAGTPGQAESWRKDCGYVPRTTGMR